LCDDHEKTGKVKKNTDKCEPEPVLSFTEDHTVYETVNSFYHAPSTGKYDKEKINLDLAVSSET
jgi:hypothetical protein